MHPVNSIALSILPYDPLREMLTSALRALVKNLIKESFYGKRKKAINVLIVFFISHKNDVKTFYN